MSPFDLFNRMSALRRRDGVLVPVGPLRDLLLDVRNEQDAPDIVDLIDSHLRGTVRRSVFTCDEFDAVFHDITEVLFAASDVPDPSVR